MRCETCRGIGVVRDPRPAPKHMDSIACPDCGGTGSGREHVAEVWQDGAMVAIATGGLNDVCREIMRYAMVWSRDAPVDIRGPNGGPLATVVFDALKARYPAGWHGPRP